MYDVFTYIFPPKKTTQFCRYNRPASIEYFGLRYSFNPAIVMAAINLPPPNVPPPRNKSYDIRSYEPLLSLTKAGYLFFWGGVGVTWPGGV